MRKEARIACVLVVVCLGAGSAHAGSTLTDLLGDKDGFGIGVSSGQEFYHGAIIGSDVGGTDQWRYGTQWWTHTYDFGALGGPITSATLEIFHGGDGLYGPSTVLLNGTPIGFLTDSDASDGYPRYKTHPNIANLDVFDITAYAGLLTGSDIVKVKTATGGDGWALDYSELRLAAGEVIPAPGAALLVALGMGLVGSLRRRRVL